MDTAAVESNGDTNKSQQQQQQQQQQQHVHPICKALNGYQLYGWEPNTLVHADSDFSMDDNYLDLVMLLTRNSICKDGGMGCVLVSPSMAAAKAKSYGRDYDFYDSIISASTNIPFYSPNDSDVHAEIVALGKAAACRTPKTTEGCTAYITMPPCKRCLAALVMAGIKRIVYFSQKTPQYLQEIANKHHLVLNPVNDTTTTRTRKERINSLVTKYYEDNNINQNDLIVQERKRRKQESKAKKEQAKRKKEAQQKQQQEYAEHKRKK